MQRDRLSYLLIPLAAFIAILPLILNGCSCGHDFDFHLVSWMEAARQFTHGNLHPHWAYTPAYNSGEPRFVFYPPASWTLGAILGLILPWTWTPVVYTWVALTASGLAMHRLTRDFAGPTAAILAAVFYATNPYMLFTAYERTAYAELLAAAWIPLLLHAILRRRITIPGIALPVALLWLTNAPAAVMSCYALALLAVLRLCTHPGPPHLDSETGASRTSPSAPAHPPAPPQSRLEQARNAIAGAILGLGLAAFYILPAAYERRFVQIAMALVTGMRIQDNFLFHHTGDIPHDEVLHTVSIIAILLLVLTAAALLAASRQPDSEAQRTGAPHLDSETAASSEARPSSCPGLQPQPATPSSKPVSRRRATSILPSLALLTVAIALLLTPATTFLWDQIPELAFLQFPWRLLAILAAVLSLAISIALPSIRLKLPVATALAISIAASLTYPAYTVFHQACDPEDTVSGRLALFHSNRGSEPIDEYTPTTADNDSLAQTNPPYWLSTDPNAKAPASVSPGPSPAHLTLNTPIPQILILNLRDYPSWRITRNGRPIAHPDQQLQRDDGLIALPIPAGPSNLSIAYAQPRDQTAGDIITLISLALLLFAVRKRTTA